MTSDKTHPSATTLPFITEWKRVSQIIGYLELRFIFQWYFLLPEIRIFVIRKYGLFYDLKELGVFFRYKTEKYLLFFHYQNKHVPLNLSFTDRMLL